MKKKRMVMGACILRSKKENLLEDISVLDKEFDTQPDFINTLDKLKALLYQLFFMLPLVREFTRPVEEKRDIRAAGPVFLYPSRQAVKGIPHPYPTL